MPRSNIATVAPVLNDTNVLDRLLIRIDTWSTRPREVIVVCGAPSSEVNALCQQYQWRFL